MNYSDIEIPLFIYCKYKLKKEQRNYSSESGPNIHFCSEGLPFNDFDDIYELIATTIERSDVPKKNWLDAWSFIKACFNGNYIHDARTVCLHDFIRKNVLNKQIDSKEVPDWMQDLVIKFLKGRDYHIQTEEHCQKINARIKDENGLHDRLNTIPEDLLAHDIIWGACEIPHATKDILLLSEKTEKNIWDYVNEIYNGWGITDYYRYPITKKPNLYRCLDTGLVSTTVDISDFSFIDTDEDGMQHSYGWRPFKPVNGGTSIANIFCRTFPGITLIKTEEIPGLGFQNPFKLFVDNKIEAYVFRANAFACLLNERFKNLMDNFDSDTIQPISQSVNDPYYNWSMGNSLDEIAEKLNLESRTLRRYIEGESRPELQSLIAEHIKKDFKNPSKWMHSPQMKTALSRTLH